MNNLTKFALSSIVMASLSAHAATLTQPIHVEQGSLQGVLSADQQIEMYKGIPYAEPPVDTLRWQSPKSAASWSGTRKATDFKAACYQIQNGGVLPWTTEFLETGDISEDCLYLNVWAPATDKSKKKPVLVYIHGGGFMEGSGSVPIYDGENIAHDDIVYVTLNYRLGIFGFLASSDMVKNDHASGNYGLEDQITALKWIKHNIAAFGGDANNITIMGQSAGANSVLMLNSSPLTQGLFNRSIIQSSTPTFYHTTLSKETLLESRMTSATLAAKTAATDAFLKEHQLTTADLKSMPAADLLKLINPRQVPVTPAIDGHVFDKSLYEVYTTTHRHTGPIMMGFTQDETSGFIPDYRVNDEAVFKKYVERNYPTNAQQIQSLYPSHSIKELNRQENLIATHNLAQILATFTGNHVYSYYFDQDVQWQAQKEYGTFHTSDVPFALKTLDKVTGPVTKAQHTASHIYSEHVLQFVKTGNPNANDEQWAPINTGDKWVYRLNSTPTMSTGDITPERYNALMLFGQK